MKPLTALTDTIIPSHLSMLSMELRRSNSGFNGKVPFKGKAR